MGRQFEYNRFSNEKDIKQEVGTSDCIPKEFMQKSQSSQTNKKSKPLLKKYNDTRILPPYSELYPDVNDHHPLKDETITTTTTKRTKSTRKSVEIAIRTYHQLSKFLIQSHNDNNTSSSTTTESLRAPTAASEKDDCEMIAVAASVPVPSKKPKVYDCMRDFLRKKFFHNAVSEEESEGAVEYDEVDYLTMMEDSYGIKDVDEDDFDDDDECLLVVTTNQQTRSKCIRLVEGGCWPKNDYYLEDGDEDIDSDVGIQDCCQLLGGSPKNEKRELKSPKRKIIEYPSELRDASWFQPNISGKVAAEKLIKESPGAFIIRQSASVKPGNFILSLRMETKVKKFVILGSPRCYKIKGAKKEFSSLKALVTHHSVMAEQLPVTLALPRTTVDEKFSHRYLDDFDTFESLQILGILQVLQSKNLEFS